MTNLWKIQTALLSVKCKPLNGSYFVHTIAEMATILWSLWNKLWHIDYVLRTKVPNDPVRTHVNFVWLAQYIQCIDFCQLGVKPSGRKMFSIFWLGAKKIPFIDLWNIAYMSPVVTGQCPETMHNLSNIRCRPRSGVGKYENVKFRKSIESVTRLVHLSLEIWNINCFCAAVPFQCPKNNKQPSKFAVSNSAQKAHFCKNSRNKHCSKGHNRADLVNIVPMSTKSL